MVLITCVCVAEHSVSVRVVLQFFQASSVINCWFQLHPLSIHILVTVIVEKINDEDEFNCTAWFRFLSFSIFHDYDSLIWIFRMEQLCSFWESRVGGYSLLMLWKISGVNVIVGHVVELWLSTAVINASDRIWNGIEIVSNPENQTWINVSFAIRQPSEARLVVHRLHVRQMYACVWLNYTF